MSATLKDTLMAKSSGILEVFIRTNAIGYHRWEKLFELNFLSKKIPLDRQTKLIKSASKPVNLSECLAFNETPDFVLNTPSEIQNL